MANEAFFSVTGYVATQPKVDKTKRGTLAVSFRLGWTPRAINRATGEWSDQPSSFVSVTCYGKVAENAQHCLYKGEPIVLKGTLRVREWLDQAGVRRNTVEVTAGDIGHDMARGVSIFTKRPRNAGQSAAEYRLSQAAGRNPLPGDVATQQRDGEVQDGASDPGESRPGESHPGGMDVASADETEQAAEMAEQAAEIAEQATDEPADFEVEDSDDYGESGGVAELADTQPGGRARGRGRVRASEGAAV